MNPMEKPDPLWLPAGSIRAILALMITATFCGLWATGRTEISETELILVVGVLGGYGLVRHQQTRQQRELAEKYPELMGAGEGAEQRRLLRDLRTFGDRADVDPDSWEAVTGTGTSVRPAPQNGPAPQQDAQDAQDARSWPAG